MKVFVVGDVHGCYHTFKQLIEDHWNKKEEYLVLVGDLINKGPHSFEAFSYFLSLKENYPYQVFLIRGNHEQHFLNTLNSNKYNGYKQLIHDIKGLGMNKVALIEWLTALPYKWETPHILITHAGISGKTKNPFSASSPKGVLYNRDACKDIGKVQVHGHDMIKVEEPKYCINSNSWNIDTGAWTGNYLSAIRLSRKGKLKTIVKVSTHSKDLEQ